MNLNDRDRRNILEIITTSIAKKGYKPLSYAVKIVSRDELNEALKDVTEDSEKYRRIFESGLIYLGTFGLVDPLR